MDNLSSLCPVKTVESSKVSCRDGIHDGVPLTFADRGVWRSGFVGSNPFGTNRGPSSVHRPPYLVGRDVEPTWAVLTAPEVPHEGGGRLPPFGTLPR